MSRLSKGWVEDSTDSTVFPEHEEQHRQQPSSASLYKRSSLYQHQNDSEETSVEPKERLELSEPVPPDLPQVTSQDKDLEKGEVPAEQRTAVEAAKERDPNLVSHLYSFRVSIHHPIDILV